MKRLKFWFIFLIDLCKRVHCAPNAECEAGLCQCKTGYQGDGFNECTPVEVDPSRSALLEPNAGGSNRVFSILGEHLSLILAMAQHSPAMRVS